MGGQRTGIGLYLEIKDTGNDEWLHNSMTVKNEESVAFGDTYQISLSTRFNNCHDELEYTVKQIEGLDYRKLRELGKFKQVKVGEFKAGFLDGYGEYAIPEIGY